MADPHLARWPEGPLTLAVAHYDRHVPLLEGAVTLPHTPLCVLNVGQSDQGRHGTHRHENMLQHHAYDVAEVSLSSYLMARDQGAPFTAIPVFPRRLFSLSQMWTHQDAGIRSPEDLRGKKVGLNTFQTTLSVLAKADLERMYGFGWRSIHWVLARDETMAYTPADDVQIERIPDGERMTDWLLEGRLSAIMLPHPPQALLENPAIHRVIADPMSVESVYFSRYGYFPIMHVVAFRDAVLTQAPELAMHLYRAFEESFTICTQHWDDPNWSMLAWGRHALERERETMAANIWPNGIHKNRDNLAWFIAQSYDQGLIHHKMEVEQLFHPSTLST